MSFWRAPKKEPEWLTGVPAHVEWPPPNARPPQSMSHDPKNDDSLELNVLVAWYQATENAKAKAARIREMREAGNGDAPIHNELLGSVADGATA